MPLRYMRGVMGACAGGIMAMAWRCYGVYRKPVAPAEYGNAGEGGQADGEEGDLRAGIAHG